MEALPPELKIEVIQRVDEISALSTLIHSIPSFFNVFIKAKGTILRIVLRRAIQPLVTRDALNVLYSSKLTVSGPDEVRRFLEDYKHRLKTKDSITLTESSSSLSTHMGLARKHKLVEWFTHDLCSTILSRPPFTQQGQTKSLAVSTEETVRIHRALYRFELYCDLFKPTIPSRLDPHEARERLLDLWPAWEVEELSCIHTYLSRRLSDVIDEVAEHDVELGDFYGNIAFDRFYLNEMKEYALSLGLRFLHNLLTETTYKRRRQILAGHRDSDMNFLGRTLEMGPYKADELSANVAETGSVAEMEASQTRSCNGRGPNEAWLWAHRSEGYARDYCAMNKTDLREWCYCIWDKRRLSSLEDLATPWSEDRFNKWREAVEQECDARYKKIAESLSERCDVLMLGGSGYWTEDWTQLIWPPGREPGPRRSVPPENQYIVDWQPRNVKIPAMEAATHRGGLAMSEFSELLPYDSLSQPLGAGFWSPT